MLNLCSRRRWLASVAILLYCLGTWLAIDLLDTHQKVEDIPFPKAQKPSYDPFCTKEDAISREHEIACGSGGVLVLGAVTAIGSWLTLTLMGAGIKVFPVAHTNDAMADELAWYRRDQLLNAGIKVHFVNTSKILTTLLQTTNISSIVYVPRLLDSSQSNMLDNKLMDEDLNNFISILEISKDAPMCSLILLTRSSKQTDNTLLAAWSQSFEATLAVYHRLYHIPAVLIHTGGLYGPWTRFTLDSISQGTYHVHQCWYIADVALVVSTALTIRTHCLVVGTEDCNATDQRPGGLWDLLDASLLHSLEYSVSSSYMWGKAYVTRDMNKQVVMTSYFTTARDPQWNVSRPSNQFQYMLDWYLSLKQLGMEAVIFHDGLDLGFMHRILKDYTRISFVLVPSLQNRSTNDARFYAYQRYLDDHPDISMVLLTDISDVRFQKNPFPFMHLLGDNVYVGTDIDVFPSIKYMPWISGKLEMCFGHYAALGSLRCLSELDTVYNAGVIGGSRHAVMAVLWWVTHYLDHSPTHLNCNMAAVNVALHKHFYRRIFTGFPLVSRFMYKQTSPKGVYIIHK